MQLTAKSKILIKNMYKHTSYFICKTIIKQYKVNDKNYIKSESKTPRFLKINKIAKMYKSVKTSLKKKINNAM